MTSSVSAGRIAVVGGGSIGVAWAIVFARAGHPVRIYDVDAGRRDAVPAEIRSRITDLAGNGLLPANSVDAVASRVAIATDLGQAVDGAIHLQECVLESVDLKRSVFAELDRICDPETVLAEFVLDDPLLGVRGRAARTRPVPGGPPRATRPISFRSPRWCRPRSPTPPSCSAPTPC